MYFKVFISKSWEQKSHRESQTIESAFPKGVSVMKYVCDLCGYVYDGAETAFADLPADYACPECGSGKESFISASRGESPIFHGQNSDSQR